MLLAPVRMLFHTQFVLAALTGWKLDWKSPPRDDAVTPWREAARRHGVHSLLALAWVVAIVVTSKAFPWWLSPVIIGILAAIPLSALGSHSAPGRWMRKHGIFLIPEEVREPHVLGEARRFAEAFADDVRFVDAVVDTNSHRAVAGAVAIRPEPAGDKARARALLVAQAASDGPSALDRARQHRLLGDAAALAELRERVVTLRQAHPAWWQAAEPASAAQPAARPAQDEAYAGHPGVALGG